MGSSVNTVPKLWAWKQGKQFSISCI